jgi:predicted PurR-regulated permease PerM
LGILVFIIVRPVLISILIGLVLAYIFSPVYKKIYSKVGYKTLSASIISFLIVLSLLLPLWFIVPLVIQQVFDVFTSSQTFDMTQILKIILPTAPDKFVVQFAVNLNSIISKASSTILNSLINIILDLPRIVLHFVIVAFVFFFALRDHEEMTQFASEISPFNKTQEKVLINQFKDITDAVVYGNIINGLVQGILAGAGFLIFGVNNALILTLIAVLLSMIPTVGPSFVWLPVAAYMFATGNPYLAALFLAYNILIVSTVDNILRPYIVSRRTDVPAVIVMIGIIGGLIVMGLPGILIGPLVLAYFITFLRAYKEKTLSSLFSDS